MSTAAGQRRPGRSKMPNATKTYRTAYFAGLTPDPELLLSEWANARFILPPGTAKEHGPYRWERTPYWKEVMDTLSPSCPVQEVCCMTGVQIGKTTMGILLTLFAIDQAPGPILFVMPTGDMADEHSKDRIQPAIDAMPSLKGKVREAKSRNSGNTINHKQFPGGSLKITGANSPRAFRSKQVRYLILDDVDGFEQVVGAEGDPCALARKRTTTYGSIRKIYENSTPTVKGISRIERSYLDSDQRKYHVPCPLCGEKQVLEWGGKDADYGLRFTHVGPVVTDSWYQCRYCHERIEEGRKPWMFERGEWIPGQPDNTIRRGYHLSSLYSPLGWKSWNDIAQEFLSAGKSPQLLQVWTNTILADPWEERGSQPDWVMLKNRAEPYRILEVPHGGLMLTAGVDVQMNRLEPFIWAWGRDEECWLIYAGAIYESPETDRAWEVLDELLSMQVPHANGALMPIVSAGIDAGYATQAVYAAVRRHQPRWFALKGMSNPGKPVVGQSSGQDITYGGKVIKNGMRLWPVGVDTAKSTIYGRFNLTPPGPRTVHTPIGVDDEFYRQLTAEKLVTRYNKGFARHEWVMIYQNNHALDGFIYAYAAAIRAGMLRMNWAELERAVKPIGNPEPDRPKTSEEEAEEVKRKPSNPYLRGRSSYFGR
jgi:terminase, large subunit